MSVCPFKYRHHDFTRDRSAFARRRWLSEGSVLREREREDFDTRSGTLALTDRWSLTAMRYDAIRCSFSRSRFLDDMDASYHQVAARSNGSKTPPNGPGGGYGRLGVEFYTQEPGYAPEVMNNVMLHGKH
jgi:hypothetical protein